MRLILTLDDIIGLVCLGLLGLCLIGLAVLYIVQKIKDWFKKKFRKEND